MTLMHVCTLIAYYLYKLFYNHDLEVIIGNCLWYKCMNIYFLIFCMYWLGNSLATIMGAILRRTFSSIITELVFFIFAMRLCVLLPIPI